MATRFGTSADLSEFAAACGQGSPLRFRLFDSRSGEVREIRLPGPSVLIGSSEDSDLCLHDPEVSRRHAYLQVIDGHLVCCDLDSRTGVHWGKTSRPRGWLHVGESLHIGPYIVTLLDSVGDREHSVPVPARFSNWDAPGERITPFVLTFLNAHSRSGKKRICHVARRITLVGWSDVCNLRLQHHSVERVHCSFLLIDDSLWVVDLKSESGIEVNERPIEHQRLRLGDHIRLGKFQLTLSPTHQVEFDDESGQETDRDGWRAEYQESDDQSDESHGVEPKRRDRRIPGGLVPTGGLRPAVAATEKTGAPSEVDPGTAALLQHFQSMQQQFMDHTQQMMSMVVQAFSTAHNRQLDVIREELQRVNELSRELQELHARRSEAYVVGETGSTHSRPEIPPLEPARPEVSNEIPPVAPTQAPKGQFPPGALSPNFLPPGAIPTGMFPPGVPIPGMFPAGVFPAGVLPPGIAPPGVPVMPVAPSAALRTPMPKAAARPREPAPDARESERPSVKPPTPEVTADLHLQLNARINELDRERTSRWSRILQLLTSGGGS